MEKYKSWNPFVTATIAFLKKDRNTLLAKREELENLPHDPITNSFINAVDSLIKDFNKPYLGNQPKSREM